jgi:ABC-type branched-subunit amino acid transport system ATPase component
LKQVSRTELDTIASAKLLLVAERLADEPEFLILDEPGWGFSFQDGINFLLTVLKTSDSMKTSVIIISHQVDVLRQICKSQINLESLGQNVVGVKVENI